MTSKKMFRKSAIAAAVAAISCPITPLIAQSPVIEEVFVTATRRAASVQDIPINISAISGAAIEKQGISDLTELAQWVPGITVVDQGARGSNAVIVRGLSTDVLSGSEGNGNNSSGTVATYLGEIPIFVDLKLNDMERVEVLLGPQGTLYGAGTLAGAIRYIPNKPQMGETTLQVRGDLSSISESDDLSTDVGFTFNTPLADNLALRANLDYLDGAGFIDYNFLVLEPGVSNPEPDFSDSADVAANLTSQKDANYEKALTARLSLLWDVSDDIAATFSYNLQDQEIGGRQINSRDAFGTGDYESAFRFPEYNERKSELFSLEVVADLGFAELTSATGYSKFTETGQRDQTDLLLDIVSFYGDFPAFVAFTLEEQEEERINQELRLVSTSDSDFSWILGAFYNSYDIDDSSKEFAPGLPDFFGIDSELEIDPYDDVVELEAVSEPIEFFAAGPTYLDEVALFGEFSYQISDDWQVTAGGRWFDYELLSAGFTQFPLFTSENSPYTENTVEDSGNLIKINTSYDINDDVMAYFTISEGYRIGDVNRFPICTDAQIAVNTDNDESNNTQAGCIFDDQQLVAPDRTTNYELGLHSTWLDKRLTVNGAIFQVDWDDIQVGGFTPFSGENITLNGGTAQSSGIELSFNSIVSNSLSLRGSFSYAKAELTQNAAALVDGEDAFDGDRLSGAPEVQGSLFATYSVPLDNYELDINYGISYSGDVLTRVGERANGETLDSYALHNMSAVLSRDNWVVAAYIDNLMDEYYETGVRSTTDQIRTTDNAQDFTLRRYFKNVGTPRTIGLSVTYDFNI